VVNKKVDTLICLIYPLVKNLLLPRLDMHKFYLLIFSLTEPLAAAI